MKIFWAGGQSAAAWRAIITATNWLAVSRGAAQTVRKTENRIPDSMIIPLMITQQSIASCREIIPTLNQTHSATSLRNMNKNTSVCGLYPRDGRSAPLSSTNLHLRMKIKDNFALYSYKKIICGLMKSSWICTIDLWCLTCKTISDSVFCVTVCSCGALGHNSAFVLYQSLRVIISSWG